MKYIKNLLFVLVLGEITLGGGGRLMAIGPVSLRMILFVLALIFTIACLLRGEKIPTEYKVLLIFFTITLTIGLTRGIMQDAQRIYWWEDVKPLMYFYMLPFFYFVVAHQQDVEKAGSIIKLSSIVLSFAFFTLLLFIHTGLLPFLEFYQPAIQSGEFFFRGELTFFYKGFLYLCVGFIFFDLADRNTAWLKILVMAAILFSCTRGFLVALSLTYMVYYFLNSSRIKSAVFGVVALLVVLFGQQFISYVSEEIDSLKTQLRENAPLAHTPDATLLGDREFSDSGRRQQIEEVIDRVTLSSFFIGHGFGVGVPSRPVHMEISYLEIMHKQGLTGLLFWASILYLLFKKYRAAEVVPLRNAFFCGAIFVFFQSLTNQYINNPIGLAMVLLALICLDRMKKSKPVFRGTEYQDYSNQKSAELSDLSF
jgi:hypothetical protein